MISTPCRIDSLSLHDALPISDNSRPATGDTLGHSAGFAATGHSANIAAARRGAPGGTSSWSNSASAPLSAHGVLDRKSTRLNSSHPSISYAVLCLKKKNDE